MNQPAASDFRSDTLTTPTDDMRAAMASARVGDDVFDEDPTVHELQDAAAEAFGKEAAVFTPSGTQANQIAIALQAGRGDEILIDEQAHPFLFEGGAIAWVSGAQARTLPSVRGRLAPDEVRAAVRADNEHFPRTKLLCVENTHNMRGGCVVPLTHIQTLRQTCEDVGIRMHIDGARIFNAAVAEGVAVGEYGRLGDTISCCLSKGLGAPVGSLLMGTREDMANARRVRKVLGGGMRQAGTLAAAGLIALREGPGWLAEDHRRARELADGLRQYEPAVTVEAPETNIVFVGLSADVTGEDVPAGYARFVEALEEAGVRVVGLPGRGVRFVLYHQLADHDVSRAVEAVGAALRACGVAAPTAGQG